MARKLKDQKEDAKYDLLNSEQYLSVYGFSFKDSYRADKNNPKDIGKSEYLKHVKFNV
ncbi:hypothetical protein [Bacillus sp. CH30_1T]|uniref:hypothetical protein n=1 Tax=Bacillus sp. CH30_1T TaxID=2604836 RepID=UPI00165E5B51|nr:hypothetical protein [Bacillus sp. CH30_1T]